MLSAEMVVVSDSIDFLGSSFNLVLTALSAMMYLVFSVKLQLVFYFESQKHPTFYWIRKEVA